MKSVFVDNMNCETTEGDLQALFEPFGEIGRVHVLKRPGRSASGACVRTWSGLVDSQVSAAQFFAVEIGDGLGGFHIIGHFDKCKPARQVGIAIVDKRDDKGGFFR